MAGRIPQAFLDDLLARVDIVEVIDRRVKLKKSGKNYTARCPFHDEKTPSFSVNSDKQFYYCFGCGAGGNALGFLMDYENLDFPRAVEALASGVGLEVPRESGPGGPAGREREQRHTALYNLLEQTARFYRRHLRSHPQAGRAVAYLKRRGLTGEIARRFDLGFAPPGWDNLLTAFGDTLVLSSPFFSSLVFFSSCPLFSPHFSFPFLLSSLFFSPFLSFPLSPLLLSSLLLFPLLSSSLLSSPLLSSLLSSLSIHWLSPLTLAHNYVFMAYVSGYGAASVCIFWSVSQLFVCVCVCLSVCVFLFVCYLCLFVTYVCFTCMCLFGACLCLFVTCVCFTCVSVLPVCVFVCLRMSVCLLLVCVCYLRLYYLFVFTCLLSVFLWIAVKNVAL